MKGTSRTRASYELDYAKWLVEQSDAIRMRRWETVDADLVAEEIEDIGKSERRAVRSHLNGLLVHVLKCVAQPEKASRSWQISIAGHSQKIAEIFEDSPSLRRELDSFLERAYPGARRRASLETALPLSAFPATLSHEVRNRVNAALSEASSDL